MFSMFTTFRNWNDESFEGKWISDCQKYAVKSWQHIVPKPEIIAIYEDGGTANIAREYDFIHLPDIPRTRYQFPSLSNVFSAGMRAASNDTLMYTNGDIIYLSDVGRAVIELQSKFDSFLGIGQRWDVNPRYRKPWSIGKDDWRQQIINAATGENRLRGPGAMDYFIFSRKSGIYDDIPKTFTISARRWDNWLVWKALAEGAAVVDMTDVIFAVHLDHPKIGAAKHNASVRANEREAKGKIYTLRHATHWMTDGYEVLKK